MRLNGAEGFNSTLGYHVASATELKCAVTERGIWLREGFPEIEISDDVRAEVTGSKLYDMGLDADEIEEFALHYEDTGELPVVDQVYGVYL